MPQKLGLVFHNNNNNNAVSGAARAQAAFGPRAARPGQMSLQYPGGILHRGGGGCGSCGRK